MASQAHAHHDDHNDHAHHTPTGWRRYMYSTNHKDIGTLYIIFAICAGIVGTLLVDRHPHGTEWHRPWHFPGTGRPDGRRQFDRTRPSTSTMCSLPGMASS